MPCEEAVSGGWWLWPAIRDRQSGLWREGASGVNGSSQRLLFMALEGDGPGRYGELSERGEERQADIRTYTYSYKLTDE